MAFWRNLLNAKRTLYVPEGCVEAYRNAEGWNLFQNILEFDPTGVNDILEEKSINVVPVEYYDIYGEKYDLPQKGYNIIKYNNGQKRKVLVTE